MAIDARAQLHAPPKFILHRETAGAPAAEPGATLADYGVGNYPPANCFDAASFETAQIYWTGTGVALADRVTFEPLVYDGVNTAWTRLATVQVAPNTLTEIQLLGAPVCFLRIHAVSFGGAVTNFRARVAGGKRLR